MCIERIMMIQLDETQHPLIIVIATKPLLSLPNICDTETWTQACFFKQTLLSKIVITLV